MEFSFEKTMEEVMNRVAQSIAHHKGLVEFAKQRAKFEGWVKVEVCEALKKTLKGDFTIIPEKYYKQDSRGKHIDIVFSRNKNNKKFYAIEIKVVNTNYDCEEVEDKTRPITKNIDSLQKDIVKLKRLKSQFSGSAVLFIVFPLNREKDDKKWKHHLKKIKPESKNDLYFKEFKFYGSQIPGMIYVRIVS